MELGMMFGLGFALGIVAGLHICRIVWPEFEESIWDRRSKEKRLMNDAVEQFKRTRDDESEYGRREESTKQD